MKIDHFSFDNQRLNTNFDVCYFRLLGYRNPLIKNCNYNRQKVWHYLNVKLALNRQFFIVKM